MAAENQDFRLNIDHSFGDQKKSKGHKEKTDAFELELSKMLNRGIKDYESLEVLIDEVDKEDRNKLSSGPPYNPLQSSMMHERKTTKEQERQDLLSKGKHGEVKKRGLD